MTSRNINTSDYWNQVYRREWESGKAESNWYCRDYGLIHDAIIQLIPDGSRVLDVACGPGLLCRKIRQRLPRSSVTGVDFSQYAIARNQQRDQALGIEYRHLDIQQSLGSLEGQFDVVMMCEILEHLDEPEAVVAKAMSCLRPDGRFVLTCPHDDAVPDPEHVRTWGHNEVFHLLAPYGETISFRHFPPPCFDAWMLAHLTRSSTEGTRKDAA